MSRHDLLNSSGRPAISTCAGLMLLVAAASPIAGAQAQADRRLWPDAVAGSGLAQRPVSGLVTWRPEDPSAPTPPVVHRAAVTAVHRVEPTAVGSWLQANRVVDAVGGWRSYLKEAHDQPSALGAK